MHLPCKQWMGESRHVRTSSWLCKKTKGSSLFQIFLCWPWS